MDQNPGKLRNAPLAAVSRIAAIILGGEFAIMAAIEWVISPMLGNATPLFWGFFDPLFLTALVAPALYFFVFRPMHEQQLILEKQKNELAIAAVTFNAHDGVIVTDESHIIIRVNQSFTKITGYESEDVLGKTPAVLQSGRQSPEFYSQMKEALACDKCWQGEIWNRRKSGEIFPEWLTITSVGSDSGKQYYVGVFSDITNRKLYEEKISFMAYHDQLTRLPSRELFYEALSNALSQVNRRQDSLALFYLDLDGFKAINDAYGHEAGDEVLKIVSRRLESCVRDEDTVARLGGDEFAIILSGIASSSDATSVAEKIIRKLSETMNLQADISCTVGVSIGIAIYPEHGAEIDRLIGAADSAMYKSKLGGKNSYTICSCLE